MSVGSHKDSLNRLKSYNNSPSPILSVYVQIPPKQGIQDGVIHQNCLSIVQQDLSEHERNDAQKNLEYVLGFLESYQSKGNEQSLAIFSGGDSLFEVIRLPYKAKNAAYMSHSPYLQPILEEDSTYRRYLIIFMDREKAKFFIITHGIVERSDDVYDPSVPQNVHADSEESANNGREDKINRHIQDHIHRHFEKIVQDLNIFIEDDVITGVIIGGHKNLFQKFENHLPKNLHERVVGEFVTELNINTNLLVNRSKKIIEEIDQKLNHQQSPFVSHH